MTLTLKQQKRCTDHIFHGSPGQEVLSQLHFHHISLPVEDKAASEARTAHRLHPLLNECVHILACHCGDGLLKLWTEDTK